MTDVLVALDGVSVLLNLDCSFHCGRVFSSVLKRMLMLLSGKNNRSFSKNSPSILSY